MRISDWSSDVCSSDLDGELISKGNHRHYMIKEIYEQPIVVAQTLRSYLQRVDETLTLPIPDFDLSEIKRVTIVACGTSFYAGMAARYWVEQFACVPVDLDVARSEERREGKEWVGKCRYGGAGNHKKKKN